MGSYHLLYFSLLLCICIQITHPTSVADKCRPNDKSALLNFFNTFVYDPLPSLECRLYDWNKSNDCCSWTSVTCDSSTGKIVGLSMSDDCKQGTSSSFSSNSSLFRLKTLQSLNLQIRLPQLTIPNEIAKLTQLQTLYLGTNFIGPIPDAIGSLTNLKELGLFSNSFLGNIPLFIGKLQNLQLLNLEYGLTGNIPLFIANLPKLQILRLASNSLTGTIPAAFFSRTCRSLTFGQNQLRGSLLPLGESSNFSTIRLSNNMLEGTIPSWLFTLASLEILDLTNNSLGPLQPFPKPATTSLSEVLLDFNMITGPFPSSLLQLANISSLFLGANKLTGVVEWNSFKFMEKLRFLSLSSNEGLSLKKTGRSTINLPSFLFFDMRSCSLKEFPEFLSGYKNLLSLDVSDNQSSGAIFKQRGWMRLDSFNGSNNKITTFEFPNHVMLFFSLSYNIISCSLRTPPPSIQSLSLENNKLSGEIPNLMRLKYLNFLNLSYNNFRGRIPPSKFSNDSFFGNPGLCGPPLTKLC